MFVHIGVFLMAIAFAIFAIYLSKLLKNMAQNIELIGKTTGRMESKFDHTLYELEQMLIESNGTAKDVELKLDALNSVFQTTEELGQAAQKVSGAIVKMTSDYNEDSRLAGTRPFIRIIQASEFAISLYQSWKRGRTVGKEG